MKSQKGVTMISLILYIASFVAVTTVVAGITTFFYGNMKILDTSVGSNSAYSKINLYMVNECKKANVSLLAWKDKTNAAKCETNALTNASSATNTFITFLNQDGSKNSFIYDDSNKKLYYNYIKLSDKVDKFEINVDRSTGKEVLSVLIQIDGTAFRSNYVIGS